MRRRALLVIGALLGGCYPPVPFKCLSDANCVSRGVQGRCEVTDFCSYPGDKCPSGMRYDEFAGEGLADNCTQTAGSGSGSGSDSAESSETGDCPPVPDCDDGDGDGYGIGADCLGDDCDDDHPGNWASCVYIAPDGDDGASGTRDAPWRTFGRAVPELAPGDSLVLLDGSYEPDSTGLPDIDCSEEGSARDGTADAWISIRADNERAAWLRSDGSAAAFRMRGCSRWRIFGLRGSSADLGGAQGGTAAATFRIELSANIEARRLLWSNNNRYFNNHLYAINDSQDVLVEESEAYDYHRYGFIASDSANVTFRRCYARSNYPDLEPCVSGSEPDMPYCSGNGSGGDNGFVAYGRETTGTRFENCIVEGDHDAGFHVTFGADSNTVEGSICVAATNCFLVAASDVGRPAEDNVVSNSLAIGTSSQGVFARSTSGTIVESVTALEANGAGLRADEHPDAPCSGLPRGCGVTARNVLALDAGDWGLRIDAQDAWSIESCNAFGSGTEDYWGVTEPIDDQAGDVRASLSVDPSPVGLGANQCAVYIPDDSSMKGAGAEGADIGANILYRSEDTPTQVPLWDPDTGRFPCGAVVEGVNDDPDSSCVGVHARLNVATGGCPLPVDYGAADDAACSR